MGIRIVCPRCKNQITVEDDRAGQPLQCGKCRFVTVIPRPQVVDEVPPPPPPEAWEAAAEMEQSATAYETLIVVRRPRGGGGSPAGRARLANWALVGMALVPVIIAVVLLVAFAGPWSSSLRPAPQPPTQENVKP